MYEPSCSRLRPKWDMGVEQRRHEISRSLPSGIAACSDLHPAGGGSPSIPLPQFQQRRSEEHTSELQSLMRLSYAVFCLKKKKHKRQTDYRARMTDKHVS